LEKQDPFLPSTVTDLAGTFDIGLEKRKQITNKLTAFYGINFVVMTTFQRTKTEDPALSRDLRHVSVFSVNPGLGFNSGFIYTISGEFSIAAEISPRLLYHYSTTERISGAIKVNDTTQGGSVNIGNQSVKFSLIYHWIKD